MKITLHFSLADVSAAYKPVPCVTLASIHKTLFLF